MSVYGFHRLDTSLSYIHHILMAVVDIRKVDLVI